MNLEPINAICRTHAQTGAYYNARFVFTPADFYAIRDAWQGGPIPEMLRPFNGAIPGLTGIPVILGHDLEPGHWRLVDHDGEGLHAGNLLDDPPR